MHAIANFAGHDSSVKAMLPQWVLGQDQALHPAVCVAKNSSACCLCSNVWRSVQYCDSVQLLQEQSQAAAQCSLSRCKGGLHGEANMHVEVSVPLKVMLLLTLLLPTSRCYSFVVVCPIANSAADMVPDTQQADFTQAPGAASAEPSKGEAAPL